MAIHTDGQKKQGRLLKKDTKILSSVQMVNFSFEQIATNPLVSFDNAQGSIIHSRYHEPGQLKQVVREHVSLNETVQDVHKPQLGVIFPADFTQDWHNERMNSKRRAMGIEDDDEIDILEQARLRARSQGAISYQVNPGDDNSDEELFSEPLMQAHASSPDSIRSQDADGRVKTLNEGDMATAISKAFAPPSSSQTESLATAQEKSFEPLPTENTASAAIEDKAIETWKSKQQIAKQNEQLLEELRTQARAEGFQAGFREGEEKGLLSGQKNAAQVFSKVSEILNEFSGLKELILNNVQKNFYELSQAIGEALLGREFSIKPEAYATMIQRVIKDTIAPNDFKVRMHPETWQKVHNLNLPDLEPCLVKDQSIPIGDFRVESNLTVVDVTAKKLVTQLLEKTDINLFDEKKVS
jgi:flagellar biosynthesis/type III secretory pathway protein FliH